MGSFAKTFDDLTEPVQEAMVQALRQAGANAQTCRSERQTWLSNLELAVSLCYATEFSRLVEKLSNRVPLPHDLREANRLRSLLANTVHHHDRKILMETIGAGRKLSDHQVIWYLTQRGEIIPSAVARRKLTAAADVVERMVVNRVTLDQIRQFWNGPVTTAPAIETLPVVPSQRAARMRRRHIRR